MKEKIAITGSEGTIGTVLKKGLSDDYDITPIDILTGIDVRDYQQLLNVVRNHSAIIHLAWDTKVENFQTDTWDDNNTKMFLNVYKTALETGVTRVIMASSVHADTSWSHNLGGKLLSPDVNPVPANLYGAHKIAMEAVGRYYASKGLEVVCLRIGGINPQNDYGDNVTGIKHNDLISFVDNILKAKKVPDNFEIDYAVSDNQGKVHNTRNSFSWEPKKRNT